MNQSLNVEAEKLYDVLKGTDERIVFAESCTGGLIAATLAGLSGISEYLCGSAVVYQVETKTNWLNVSPESIQQAGVVSEIVATEMANGVIKNTPQATLSASITGHLGPHAPAELDGIVCIGITRRNVDGTLQNIPATTHQLITTNQPNQRLVRQHEAAELVIHKLQILLKK